MKEVATLYESNYRDPVATLRALADDIERGEYGDVGGVALAMVADEFAVFGMGPESEPGHMLALFCAGQQYLTRGLLEVGQ